MSELVLAEQHARMAVPAPTERKPEGQSVEALQGRIQFLETQVNEKDQVAFDSPLVNTACKLGSLLSLAE